MTTTSAGDSILHCPFSRTSAYSWSIVVWGECVRIPTESTLAIAVKETVTVTAESESSSPSRGAIVGVFSVSDSWTRTSSSGFQLDAEDSVRNSLAVA